MLDEILAVVVARSSVGCARALGRMVIENLAPPGKQLEVFARKPRGIFASRVEVTGANGILEK